jgi:hypothetical protein
MVKKSADIDTPLYDALDKLGAGTLQVPTLHPDIAGDENVVAVASVMLHLFKTTTSDDSETVFLSIRTAGQIVGRNKYQGSIILETLCEYEFMSECVKGEFKKRETDEDGKQLGGFTATTFWYTGTDEIYDRTQVPKVTEVTEVAKVTEVTNETQRRIGETDNINDSVSPLTASLFESEILEYHSLCEREGITGRIRRTQIAAIIARYVDGNGEDIVDEIMELIKAHKLKTVTNELRLMLEESSGRITLAQLESDLKDS